MIGAVLTEAALFDGDLVLALLFGKEMVRFVEDVRGWSTWTSMSGTLGGGLGVCRWVRDGRCRGGSEGGHIEGGGVENRGRSWGKKD